jgi:hypothetical protein
LLGILVKHGVEIDDQEAVVVLFLDGHEMEAQGAADVLVDEVVIQPTDHQSLKSEKTAEHPRPEFTFHES